MRHASGPSMPEKCSDCPFREDGRAIMLSPSRLRGIQLCVVLSRPFSCHKTLGRRPLECAGALEYRERVWAEKGVEAAALDALQELLALPEEEEA